MGLRLFIVRPKVNDIGHEQECQFFAGMAALLVSQHTAAKLESGYTSQINTFKSTLVIRKWYENSSRF